MSDTKTTFTTEQLEAARAATIEENAKCDKERSAVLVGIVDEAIASLSANRDHIGAIALVIVCKPGSAIVDTEDGTASSGVSIRYGMNNRCGRILHTHLLELAEQ